MGQYIEQGKDCSESVKCYTSVPYVIAGMDTEGEIFDDCLVMLLKETLPEGDADGKHVEGAAAGPS